MSAALARRTGHIVERGMTDHLTPPAHPERTYSVQLDGSRERMSLSDAAARLDLDPELRLFAEAVLRTWHPLGRPPIAWARSVLQHFRHCYRNPEAGAREWAANEAVIDCFRDPMAHADDHMGVHFIRRFYRNYTPVPNDFDEPSRK